MNRSGFQKMMFSVTLIYLGLMLSVIPYFLHSTYAAITVLLDQLGILCVFIGTLLLFYNRLSKKIDDVSNNILNMSKAGIEQIIPADSNNYNYFEKIICSSSDVMIAVNAYRLTDKFCYLLNSLLENEMVKCKIIFLGSLNDPKTHFFIEDLHKRQKENVSIRVLERMNIDNLIVFNGKACIMHYNNYDNKLLFFVTFYAGSEESKKNIQLFESLWIEGEVFE